MPSTVHCSSSGTDSLPSTVRVILPVGFTFATPYRSSSSDANSYTAANLDELWGNGNLVGVLASRKLRQGDLQVEFAGAEPMRPGLELFATSLGPILETYARQLGAPPAGKLTVMANVATQLRHNGGESFTSSISMLVPSVPDRSSRARWGYLIAHESFHQWNGNAFPPADQSHFEWLAEGFTDYMARQAMLRTGLMTEQEFWSAMASSYTVYRRTRGSESLDAAGASKGRNYDFIYGGGASVAAALDADLRQRTRGAVGVPHLLARLAARYRDTTRPYSLDDVVRITSELAGGDMRLFYSKYVVGTEMLPLAGYLSMIGIDMSIDGESFVIKHAAGSPASAALSGLLSR